MTDRATLLRHAEWMAWSGYVGTPRYRAWWQSLTAEEKHELGPDHDRFKRFAAHVAKMGGCPAPDWLASNAREAA